MLSYIVIHSDEGLTLEISVLETLHGGQFTLSRTGLNFFQALFHYCLSSANYCEDHFHSLHQLSTQLIKYKFEKKANYDDAPFTRKKTIGETDLKMK